MALLLQDLTVQQRNNIFLTGLAVIGFKGERMDPALYISMTGAKRSLAEQGVYSNNLANVNSPGFRQDLYQAQSLYLNGSNLPTQVYTASEMSAIDTKAGPMMSTNRELDAAIRGKGWFVIQNENGRQALSRMGSFLVNDAGLLTTSNGDLVMGEGGPISIPPYESIQLAEDGSISVVPLGEKPSAVTILDRLLLVNPNQKQLFKGGDGNVYLRGGTQDFSADAQVRIAPRTLEGSNVNAVDQMVHMINASKEFETQLKLMKSVDENQEVLARLLQV